MSGSSPMTILCVSSYEKGQEFMREAKRQGWRVLLLTVEHLKDADWPRDLIDEIFLMPELTNRQHVFNAVSYLARSTNLDRIVALDEFDIEMTASLREHLRVPGMGETTSRYFRDKLAMRKRAQDKGIRVPAFCPVINYDQLREYMNRVAAPWMLKPRSSASAIGIRKLNNQEELWRALDEFDMSSGGDLSRPYTIVKYSANVGDKYEFTDEDGIKVTRTVVSKSTTDDYYMGFWMIKVMKIEQVKEDPVIDKITYITNHKFGLVGIILQTKNGKTLKISILPPNS
ncbi:MAG: hypothetical protein HYZ54_02335 [Ignavibacteriae bacterium]|nr:hypothetical protein [Ignavibacteriota bacterium]